MAELVEVSPVIAAGIIEKGNRKIVDQSGNKVEWINLNNETCYLKTGKASGRMADCENVRLYVSVPASAKSVF